MLQHSARVMAPLDKLFAFAGDGNVLAVCRSAAALVSSNINSQLTSELRHTYLFPYEARSRAARDATVLQLELQASEFSTSSLRSILNSALETRQTIDWHAEHQYQRPYRGLAFLPSRPGTFALSQAATRRGFCSSSAVKPVTSVAQTHCIRVRPGETLRLLSRGLANGKTTSTASTPSAPPAAADAVYNLPNAVSAARLLLGPVIGYWLLQGHHEAATVALAVAGASDWLDGHLARRLGASSVFGSYLDPIADKVLICCVAAALLANGAMPVWLATVVVGRDVLLVSGAFAFRLRGFGWRWPGREAFFRTADAAALPKTAVAKGNSSSGAYGESGVAFMRPLFISKANTLLQLALLGGYLTQGMYNWPEGDLMLALELAVAATTMMSLAAYGSIAVQGRLFK